MQDSLSGIEECIQVSTDELSAIIKAIKFAHPHYGVKLIFKEIISKGGKYKTIKLKRVHRRMKKLGCMNGENKESDISMFTVGGKVKSNLNANALDAARPEDKKFTWVAVPLDVPAISFHSSPYQATVKLNTNISGIDSGKLGGIYKIQLAESGDMLLLYNKPRDRKTYIHPPQKEFIVLRDLIKSHGVRGIGGGYKAYFWGKLDPGGTLLRVNVDETAPNQLW